MRRNPGAPVDVILHIGAHRTGTTTLQDWLLQNEDALRSAGIACWGPDRARAGLFSGLIKRPAAITGADDLLARQSTAKIRMEIDRLQDLGFRTLLISEENILGTMLNNIDMATPYPDARARLDRVAAAFGGAVTTVALGVRRYDLWWASVLTVGRMRGIELPDATGLERLSRHPRGWCQIVEVMGEVFPGARRIVWPFEALVHDPVTPVVAMTGLTHWPEGLYRPARARNASIGLAVRDAILGARGMIESPAFGRWMPFSPDQQRLMAARYEQDKVRLRSQSAQRIEFIENVVGSLGGHPGTAEEEGNHYDRPQEGQPLRRLG